MSDQTACLTLPLAAWATSKPMDDPDLELVRASQGGDSEAFATLIDRHRGKVQRLCGRFFRHPADVDDAAQDTFVRAWIKLHTFRPQAPFEHWLTRVCLNECYGRLRKERPTEELREDDGSLPAVDPPGIAALEAERLLRDLPASDRFLLLMLYGEGWTVAEIADKTGWSTSNVKIRAFRARKKLRSRLSKGRRS